MAPDFDAADSCHAVVLPITPSMPAETTEDAVAALLAERARRKRTYPLSSAQLRLWLTDQHVDGAPIYNVSRAFEVEGPLDRAALERSVGEIVRRHSVLRTLFAFADGEPVQRIEDARTYTATRLDVRELTRAAQRRAVQRAWADEARYPFELDVDPLLRLLLVQLEPERHVIAFTLHHIVIDEWSLDIFYAELAHLYGAFSAGRDPELGPLPMQYVDYAVWERAQHGTERLATQLTYWKAQLAQFTPLAGLPIKQPRPEVPSFAGAARSAFVAPEHIAPFIEIAARAEATPFMTYLAAFAVLLHDVTDAADLVIGAPVSGRQGIETEELIGFFANTVALRFRFAGDPTFLDCVRLAKTVAVDAFANRDVPFEQVVRAVAGQRSAGGNPLVPVMFALGRSGPGLQLAGLHATPLASTPTTAKFDLLALLNERDGGLEIALHYRTDLFAQLTIDALLERFRTLIARLGAQPEAPLSVHFTAAPADEFACADPVPHAPVPLASTPLASTPLAPVDTSSEALTRVLETPLHVLWEELLERRAIGSGDDFFALGGHSLLAAQLLARIEATFGIRLPMVDFFMRPTIAGLAHALVRQAKTPAATPLAVVHRGAVQPPIVFFHGDYSGGGCYLRVLAQHLGDRTIYAIPPHGYDGGELPDSIEAMAADRLALLQRERVEPPFDLIGHCNGALVALEVARQLVAAGSAPPRVFAIGSEVFDPATLFVTELARIVGAVLRLNADARRRLAVRLLKVERRLAESGPPALPAGIARVAQHAARRFARRISARLAPRELLERPRALLERLLVRAYWPTAQPVPVGAARSAVGGPLTPPQAARATGVGAASGLAERRAASAPVSLRDAYAERMIHYRPRRYPGSVVVLRPTGAAGPDERPRGWTRAAADVRVMPIEGDHHSSITTHAAGLAERLRGCLDR